MTNEIQTELKGKKGKIKILMLLLLSILAIMFNAYAQYNVTFETMNFYKIPFLLGRYLGIYTLSLLAVLLAQKIGKKKLNLRYIAVNIFIIYLFASSLFYFIQNINTKNALINMNKENNVKYVEEIISEIGDEHDRNMLSIAVIKSHEKMEKYEQDNYLNRTFDDSFYITKEKTKQEYENALNAIKHIEKLDFVKDVAAITNRTRIELEDYCKQNRDYKKCNSFIETFDRRVDDNNSHAVKLFSIKKQILQNELEMIEFVNNNYDDMKITEDRITFSNPEKQKELEAIGEDYIKNINLFDETIDNKRNQNIEKISKT